ncbi:DUF5671 domain-containing protein [Fluviibacterium sp. S390]|uniref:DUF5671 domain-containing protein n=1 Tax=Fluviibacterium sp. S390 TaxID=3415139 RepID=UPI003C7B99E5
MSRAQLQTFVREALVDGQDRNTIAAALASAGWDDREIARAMDLYADSDFPVPVPRPRPAISARDALFYALMFIALVNAALAVVHLLHAGIERLWGDPETRFYNTDWWLAEFLVFTPIYLRLAHLDRRNCRRDPRRRLSPVRQWLTALAVLVAAVSLLGCFVVTIHGALQGDRELVFFAKTAATALVAAAVLLLFLRPDDLDGR